MKLISVLFMVVMLTACGANLQGPKGDAGAPGANGSNGADGSDGANGADGQVPIVIVQLCQGVTTYPSAFAEVAFCIDHKLYGTYWDGKHAFTTEIPPGKYSSTSNSVPCTFKVEADCVVEN